MATRINIDRAIKGIQDLQIDLPALIANDALNHFRRSFRNEGFTDKNFVKWEPRKRLTAKDRGRIKRKKAGRIFTKGLAGPPLKGVFSGRALLVDTGVLRGSIEVKRATWSKIEVGTIGVPYAGYHNSGEGGFKPIRQYIGESEVLNERIKRRIRAAVISALNKF